VFNRSYTVTKKVVGVFIAFSLQEDRSKGIVNKSELDSLSKLKQIQDLSSKETVKDTKKLKHSPN
jgi:hypothetical protein